MVTLTIDRKTVTVPEGTTILEAARSVHLDIPTLCYLKGVNEIGACRLCMVEVEGYERLVPACDNAIVEGMDVSTNTLRVRVGAPRQRAAHSLTARLQLRYLRPQRQLHAAELAADMNIIENPYETKLPANNWNPKLPVIRTASKCVQCFRCIAVCEKIQGMSVWDFLGTGSRATVGVRDAQKARRGELRLLRAVHHPLSDRRSPRAGRYRQGHLRDGQSEEDHRAADGSRRARGVG